MSEKDVNDRLPTREDFEAVRHYAGEPCECDERMKRLKGEVDSVLCRPCRARKLMDDLLRLSEVA